MIMEDVKDIGLSGLKDRLASWGVPGYRAKQIFTWIFQKGALSFSQMSDIPLPLREKLNSNFYILGLKKSAGSRSSDGTEKLLFELRDGNLVEGVNIPMALRLPGDSGRSCAGSYSEVTACISSQAGCKFSCGFCASGVKGLRRNLKCGEILDEILLLKSQLHKARLNNVVFMGTGEPLDNYANVLQAVRMINSPDAFNIGARHITISTCGIIPGINKLKEEDLQVELSVSLHAADDKLRTEIMPVNRKYPLGELIPCCNEYIEATNRQITFEYILIKGLNSDLSCARKLAILLSGLRLAKVNLIPANPVSGKKISPPSAAQALCFKECLAKSGVNVTLRKRRGADIDAACGQLRLRHENN